MSQNVNIGDSFVPGLSSSPEGEIQNSSLVELVPPVAAPPVELPPLLVPPVAPAVRLLRLLTQRG
ncbi:MAG: hypothetical protein JW940_13520 [Polyangiaceae bacterium]|nr:hypothetical protein [Polyangiaceae bacterium]